MSHHIPSSVDTVAVLCSSLELTEQELAAISGSGGMSTVEAFSVAGGIVGGLLGMGQCAATGQCRIGEWAAAGASFGGVLGAGVATGQAMGPVPTYSGGGEGGTPGYSGGGGYDGGAGGYGGFDGGAGGGGGY
jgi:hypothetical protein